MAKVYIDAAASTTPRAASFVAVIHDDSKVFQYHGTKLDIDNNQAEWEALILALKKCIQHDIKQAIVYTDSQIINDTVDKQYAKAPQFKMYLKQYQELARHFDLILISLVPRQSNKQADALAKEALYKFKQTLNSE